MRRLAVVVVILCALAEPAWARQCSTNVDRETTPVDSAVFVGEVTNVAGRSGWGWLSYAAARFKAWIGLTSGSKESPRERVTFNVKTSWKGVTVTTVEVDSYSSHYFEVGHDYMVYAFGPADYLSTDICTRTRKYFGQPDREFDAVPQLTLMPASSAPTVSVGAIAIMGALVVFVAVWEFRRRRASRTT
jgi:hypothetical protein